MTEKARVRIAKYMGDDAYSWAVFVDGVAVINGLSRREALYHQKEIRERRGHK